MDVVESIRPIAVVPSFAEAQRGDRLWPARESRLFWHLTALRMDLESIAERYVSDRENSILADFGCGNMPYRPLLEPRVGKYVGCDLTGNSLADATLERDGSLPFVDGEVDIVLSSQVLEHVENPAFYLSECRRTLNDTGLLILSTHGVWKFHPDPNDFWRWTSQGLKKVLSEAGFEILEFKGVMGPQATALQLWQDAMLPRIHPTIRRYFTRFIQWRIRLADQRCSETLRNDDACVYVTVCKKLNAA